MKVRSAKAKGRGGQKDVEELIKDHLGLGDDHVKSTPSSVTGEDIWFSKFGRATFPFSVEVKRTEKLNIDMAFAQAESNAHGYLPLLVHRKNNTGWKVTLSFVEFLEIIHEMRRLEQMLRDGAYEDV